MRGKIHVHKRGGQKQKIKIRYLVTALLLASAILIPHEQTQANNCPDVRLVFARGSGSERWVDQNYLAFEAVIESKLQTINLNYEFIDLDYPAIGIGVDNLGVTIRAAIGTGDAYEFGESIDAGVRALENLTSNTGCPTTKYVIGGYSQGAMVVSKALRTLDPDKIIYAATFGDPKIYLPEGEGLLPAACRGENLSDYRMYVPDCQAYKGLLGAYEPYEPAAFIGKVGTWCNRRDIFCSSHFNMSDHTSYVTENLYEDASRTIFDKITKTYGLENHWSSPHDTAFLIDSTSSMDEMIRRYKNEALRLAKQTIASGGRIALFDYRDLDDPYDLVKHCDFDDCTIEKFQQELRTIDTGGGGDAPESLLSASFHTMETLNWKQGSTKSLVILTDANFLSPDRDGISFDQVVALSKRIDPVNFYLINVIGCGSNCQKLVTATDGLAITDFAEVGRLTDYIMQRHDSLPRVEENPAPTKTPTLQVTNTPSIDSAAKATIKFTSTGQQTIVILNDRVLGITNNTEITLTGLDASKPNVISLVPLDNNVRGTVTTINLAQSSPAPGLIHAPATGRR